jgi:predicted phage terminase large subunit-like protein
MVAAPPKRRGRQKRQDAAQSADWVIYRAAQTDLGVYGALVHATPPAPHHAVWIKALMDPAIDRLLIIAPPDHAKSQWVGVNYCAWAIARNPNLHVGFISNSAPQAYTKSVAIRDTIQANQRYQALFPWVKPDIGKGWGEAEWFIQRTDPGDKDPTCKASGVGGPILGYRFDLLVMDDVADQENMSTAHQRAKTLEWIQKTALTRVTPGGRVVCVMTRWHEQDPAAYFAAQGWTVIKMPALGYWDGLGMDGAALWPERWSAEALRAIKADWGSTFFAGMYQGDPEPEGGEILKRHWWQRYTTIPEDITRILQVWDTAFKAATTNDYSVCQTWGSTATGYYLLDVWRGRVEYPELLRAVRDLYDKWHPRRVYVEDKASGQSLVQSIKRETRIPVIPVQVDQDKVRRVNAITGIVESGRAFIPESAPWVSDFVDECAVFPNGAYDDQVDCVSMALSKLDRRGGKKIYTGSEFPERQPVAV